MVGDTMKALVDLGHAGRTRSTREGGERHRLRRQDQHQGSAARDAVGPGADLGQHGVLQQPCRRADQPGAPAARGRVRRVRDRHEPSRRDRAAGAPGRGACRRDHQRRAGPHRLLGLRRGHRRREGRPLRRHEAPAPWPCSIATTATSRGWPSARKGFGIARIVGFGEAMRRRMRGLSRATCRPTAATSWRTCTDGESTIASARRASIRS